jgi:G6PDH family F420-dependent oxidoreductase
MPEIGYAISSEEHAPSDIVEHAVLAEQAGFPFALISDHYHPWVDAQGHSPFVWAVIGGIATAAKRLRLGTGVTCPSVRIHPAIIAQAAATAAAMMPGRFFLGVGSGENLNEHILGDRWPSVDTRQEMMEEAIDVIRLLWQGGYQSHDGQYFVVENARIYDLPEQLPEIMVAASGPEAAELAGEVGDGLIGTAPDREVLGAFSSAGGEGKPTFGQLTVCWGKDEAEARRLALKLWPNAGIPGAASTELPLPLHYQQLAELVTEEQIAEKVVCGPDPERHLEKIREYADAGYSHVYIHQVGPDQAGMIRFYEREILPKLS